MKVLIIAITLLFSSAVLAQAPEPIELDLSPEELSEFVVTHINLGLAADVGVYTGYLTFSYNHGTPVQNITIAMRYVTCSLVWRQILDFAPETEGLKHQMLNHAIWRSIAMAEWFTEGAGGDPDRVQPIMVPIMASAGPIPISDAIIRSCTAFDVAAYEQLDSNGYEAGPADDWTPEPIPVPEHSEEPKEPRSRHNFQS